MIKNVAKNVWNFLLQLQRIILVVSSLLLVLGLIISVIMRYILKMDLFGIEELLLVPTFWLYFFGASYGTYTESHITADLLDVYIESGKVRAMLKVFTSFINLLLCLVITYWGIEFFSWSLLSGSSSSVWSIPGYVPHSAISIGFILMSTYFLMHFINRTKEMITLYK